MAAIAIGASAVVVCLVVLFSSRAKSFLWKHAWKIGLIGIIGGVILRFLAP